MDHKPELDGLMMLAGALSGQSPDETADELQKRDQGRAIATEQLPSRIYEREQWESLGVVFGETVADDPLFLNATLPEGWHKQRTDHAMHISIVDACGNVRGSYFYKGAFWDRDALLYAPLSRYAIVEEFPDQEGEGDLIHKVVDRVDGATLFASPIPDPSIYLDQATFEGYKKYNRAMKENAKKAQDWITQHYPDHEDPTAYWPKD